VSRKPSKINQRFPLTLGVLAFYAVALMTEPLLGLNAAALPIVAAYGNVLLGMLIGGIVLLLGLSVIFTGSFDLIRPDKPFQRYTGAQALIVAAGFAAVSIFQLYVNQAVLSTVLASTPGVTVDPNTAFLLKIDSAVSEEALFGSVTIAVFLSLLYFQAPAIIAAATSLIATAGGFVTFHQYVLQAIKDQLGAAAANQAWYFFFGARIILSGVLLGTLWYSSRKLKRRAASLAAPLIIHFAWNVVS
jgi:hypothetical protein